MTTQEWAMVIHKIRFPNHANYSYDKFDWRAAKLITQETTDLRSQFTKQTDALNKIHDECFSAMEGAGMPEFEYYSKWAGIAWRALNGE